MKKLSILVSVLFALAMTACNQNSDQADAAPAAAPAATEAQASTASESGTVAGDAMEQETAAEAHTDMSSAEGEPASTETAEASAEGEQVATDSAAEKSSTAQ